MFFLSSGYVDDPRGMDITEERLRSLVASRNVIIDAVAVERLYSVLFESYRLLSNFKPNFSPGSDSDWDIIFEDFTRADGLILSFCSSARAYVDQVPQKFKVLSGEVDFFGFVKHEFSRCYDEDFAYRFIEAYRNHIQHGDLPISGMSEKDGFEVIFAERDDLSANESFKRSVLRECPKRIDLVFYVLCYIRHISKVHLMIRDFYRPHLDLARRDLGMAIIDFESECGNCDYLVCAEVVPGEFPFIYPLTNPWVNLIDNFSVKYSCEIFDERRDFSFYSF